MTQTTGIEAADSVVCIQKNSLVQKVRRYKIVYLLIIPALLLTFLFNYLPMFGLVMAFQDFDIIKGFIQSPFVGLDNFQQIFNVPKFGQAVLNTLFFSSVILFGGFLMPIILALLFNELRNKTFKRLTQTISYLPYFLSWISVVTLFYTFFAQDGPFNDVMTILLGEGYEKVNILMESSNFLGILFWSHIWKNLGWSSVIFMAAIAGLDPQLYEAAVIDGAGRWKQTLHITIPGILPTIVIIFILSTGSLVTTNFEQVFGFHNLYNQEQNEVINTLIYKQGLQYGEYSLATAFGLAQGIVSFILVYLTNKIARRISGHGIW